MLGKETFRGRVLDDLACFVQIAFAAKIAHHVVADGFYETCDIIVREGLDVSKANLAVMALVDAVGTQDVQVGIEVRG
jgi:hypothetical protein